MSLADQTDAPVFTLANYETDVKVIEVYDGDTFTVIFDAAQLYSLAAPKYYKMRCRALGYNAAEIRTKDVAEKTRGLAVRDKLREMLQGRVFAAKFGEFDNFGRALIELQMPITGGYTPLSTLMISGGFGAPYTGRGEKKWS